MRVAQIFENKAHWIFETNETMEELKARFSSECVFVDITDTDVEEGWDYDANTKTFSNTTVLTKAQQIAQLNAKYQVVLNDLALKHTVAAASDGTNAVAKQEVIIAQKSTYLAAKATERSAILNG